MKSTVIGFVLILTLVPQFSQARSLEVDVYGMTCAFCVDSLQRAFQKYPSVRKVEVSLELKKIRLETDADLPSDETIRQTILDNGFTPVKITELPAEDE